MLLIVGVLFIFRLFDLQIVNATDKLQGFRQEYVEGKRGNIFDVDGGALTQNLTFYEIGIHPEYLNDKKTLLKDISDCTGKDIDYYETKLLNTNKSYIVLEKKTNKNCQNLTRKYPEILKIEKDYKRYYPQQELFGQIVGFTDTDDRGIEGLEYQYDKHLKGKSTSRAFKINNRGKRISDPTLNSEDPEDGSDIYLTLNKEYQAILREELINQMEKTEAIGAMGIIIDPEDGRILSMVSVPDFNPNFQREFEASYKKNRIVSDLIEPGSTFKIVTIGAALEDGIELLEEYNVEGPYDFHGIKMVEDYEPNTILTMEEILIYSSNIGTIKIAEELGRDRIYNKAKELGFGSKTGLSLYGEPNGTLKNTKKWTLSSMHSVPIGYEVSVTPVHVAMAYASIANGGFLLKPYLVDKVIKNDKTTLNNKKRVKKRVLSQSNAETLKNILFKTINIGSGKKAYLEGWDVAGKTGTAQKSISGGYSESKHLSSFVGFFPKDNPQLLALIIIDEPSTSGNQHFGGVSAAPVFKSVMNRIINIDSSIKVDKKRETKNINGKLKRSNQVLIQKNIELVVVPDLKDKNVREAIQILKLRGIKPQITGSGRIVFQSLEPGTKVPKNSICKLEAKI
jgi:cell division protein FtsI/penicillin-binding protein 2|tara:strand:- start:585 stop:2453 length:1869 start_codon:yes stop_codon:yes gene_type:complete